MPHKHKIVIAGNHDLTFDLNNYSDLKSRVSYVILLIFIIFKFHKYNKEVYDAKAIKENFATHCTYLEDCSVTVMGYKIFGSPWTPKFFNWGFNLDRGKPLLDIWTQIPDETDIVITHGPPYGN